METALDDRAYWVLLTAVAGIGPIRFQRLLQLCGTAEQAWHASDRQLAEAGLERRAIADIKQLRLDRTNAPGQVLAKLERLGIAALTLQDSTYPELLRQ